MQTTSVTSSHPQDGTHDNAAPVPRAFAVLFALAGALALWVVLPYGVPLFLGATLAVTLAPLQRLLIKASRGRVGMASLLTTLLLLVLVVAPLASLVAYGATEVAGAIEWAKNTLEVSSLQDLAMGRVPAALRTLLSRAMSGLSISSGDLEAYGKKALAFGQHALPAIFGGGLGALGALILMLLSTFFFLADGNALIDVIMRLSPLDRRHTSELLDEFRAVASASLTGLAFSAVGQTMVLTFGYWMAGLPHLFFFSVASLVAAFVPLVGSMLVWLPTSIVYGIQAGAGPAAGLAIYSFFAINVIDSGLKPMLLKGKMAMHGGLTFLGMLGGLAVFGPVGFIGGPLCIALASAFLRMYQRDFLKKGEILGPQGGSV